MPEVSIAAQAPLYTQVRDLIAMRIAEGEWQPGALLPSEQRLAQQLKVSQGTVRKALGMLVNSNILVRRQGKGTYVATHEARRALFHFFHIVADSGEKSLPESRLLSCRRIRASRDIAVALELAPGSSIVHIARIRLLNAKPTILEHIALPESLFAGLRERGKNIPNALYEHYQSQYGVSVHYAEEQLRAVTASPQTAKLLKLAKATPVLEIKRRALSLGGTPVELRVSWCNTRHYHYANMIV